MMYDFHPIIPGKSRHEFMVLDHSGKITDIFRTDDPKSKNLVEMLAKQSISSEQKKGYKIEYRDNSILIEARTSRQFKDYLVKNND